MSTGKTIGKLLAMLILIVILILGGMMWFDYLGVINARTMFAPIYSMLGLQVQTSTTASTTDLTLIANLEDDRFAKRLESLDILGEELNQREQNIAIAEDQNAQIASELEEMRVALEEQQVTFNNEVRRYDDRNINIEQNARDLAAMRPTDAVEILNEMDDQDLIDTIRKVNEIAAAEGAASQASNWFSMMPPERVAEINRKMTSKPATIN